MERNQRPLRDTFYILQLTYDETVQSYQTRTDFHSNANAKERRKHNFMRFFFSFSFFFFLSIASDLQKYRGIKQV